MDITFWGVRGSYPQSGQEFVKYGGHSSCVTVKIDDEIIAFDAGSGLVSAGKAFAAQKNFHILLSHLHFDHIMGVPFFEPIWKQETTLHFYCGMTQDLEEKFSMIFSPPFFPVPWGKFPAHRLYHNFKIGSEFKIGAINVHTIELDHPGEGNGFKVIAPDGKTVIYLSDTDHQQAFFDTYVEFAKNADVLIYDATFTQSDHELHPSWGHSTWEKGTELAKLANVKQLVLFHHDPERSDAVIDALEAQAQQLFPNTIAAYEGMHLTI